MGEIGNEGKEHTQHPAEAVIPLELRKPPASFTTFIHSTQPEHAARIMETGLAADMRTGLYGVAQPFSTTETDRAQQITENHGNYPEIVIMSLPVAGLRAELMRFAQDNATEVIQPETLVMEEGAPADDLERSPNATVPAEYIAGIYKKADNTWVDNPHYWENRIKEEGKRAGLSDVEIQTKIQERRDEFIDRVRIELSKRKRKQLEDKERWRRVLADIVEGVPQSGDEEPVLIGETELETEEVRIP